MRPACLAIAIAALTAMPAFAQIELDRLPVPDPAPERGDNETTDAPPNEAAGPDEPDEPESGTDAVDIPPLPVIAEIEGCEARLDRLDVRYERSDDVEGDDGCGFSPAYRISAIGEVSLRPGDSAMRCETAVALALWVRQAVIPATRGLSREARVEDGEAVTLTGITHGPSYACRRRNNQPTGKLSHHAIGAAIDVTGFEFDGRDPIPVEPRAGRGTIEEAFQRTVRAAACMSFSTVLGPGSDDFHDDHLHLDIAARSSRYRLCQ